MFKNYLRVAARNILKNKLSASINILGLSVGMACFLLISLWIRDELSYDKFHANKDELYMLTIKHPNDIIDPNVPYALAPILVNNFPEITTCTRIFSLGNLATCSFRYRSEDGRQVMFYEDNVDLVDLDFFSMFSYSFVYGNPETALVNPDSLVLSEDIARKYFGQENPLGKTLNFNNRADLVVTGVVRVPSNSHLQFDFLAPLEEGQANNWNWGDPSYVLLDKNASAEAVREKIAGTLIEYFPHPLPEDNFTVGIMPVEKVHLDFGRMTYVYIFSVIAVLILFIACINYMNLATSCSSHRAKEVGMRKVIGANRIQLVRQFLGESVLMAVCASVLAVVLAVILLPLLNHLTSKQLAIFPIQNYAVYLILPGLAVCVGILSGLYPALFLASSKPLQALRASGTFKTNRSPFRIISVVGQFTISVLLIVSTSVVVKQLNYIQKKPLGFETNYVIKVPMNSSLREQFISFKNELSRNPNVLAVTASQAIPYDSDSKTSGIEWDGKNPSFVPNVRYSVTHFDYFETYGMEIVDGRSFSSEISSDQDNFVINEEAARYMGLQSPVGKWLELWGREGQIIGVVKDFHHVSLHREIMPHVFTVHPSQYRALKYISIKIKSEAVPDTIRNIGEISGKFAPNHPFEYSFLDKGIGNLYSAEQKLGKIFGTFASVAIFISCLGIFGLSTYTAEQRTKEIGIRKVLGATVSGIAVMLSKDFTRWVLLANILAWPISFFVMKKWLQNFAYRADMGIGLFLLAGVLSLVIAVFSVSYQSIKAALSDPAKSLKYE